PAMWRTTSGWRRPWRRIESASRESASSSKWRRGCSGLGTISWIATVSSLGAAAGVGAVRSASRPLPSDLRILLSIQARCPVVAVPRGSKTRDPWSPSAAARSMAVFAFPTPPFSLATALPRRPLSHPRAPHAPVGWAAAASGGGSVHALRPQTPPDGHAFDPPDEARVHAVHRPRELHLVQPRHEALHDLLQLEPGEVRAEAEVDADAEAV